MPVNIADVLNQWEAAGVFDFILPFLLIFAFIFGVLSGTRVLGSNKGVHLVISVSIALLSLRLGFVNAFFANVFPRLGVGLAVMMVVLILVGAFISEKHMSGWLIGFYSLGAIVGLIVIFNSFSELDWFGSFWWDEWGAWIIGALFVIGVIIAIAVPGGKGKEKKPEWWPLAVHSDH